MMTETCGKLINGLVGTCVLPKEHSGLCATKEPSWWPKAAEPVSASPLPEVCLCAAVLMPDGYIVQGHRHADAQRTAGMIPRYAEIHGMPQGFLTSRGRFVDRVEGCHLQRMAGIDSVDEQTPYLNGELYSEDLY